MKAPQGLRHSEPSRNFPTEEEKERVFTKRQIANIKLPVL